MKKDIVKKRQTEDALYLQLQELISFSRRKVAHAVNQTMVRTYFEIGRTIVLHEQEGEERAEYGKRLLKDISKKLSKDFGRGFSAKNLENMRKFYITFRKSKTVSGKFEMPDFQLSFSHYLKLIRIEDESERRFYEIESIDNQWSLRELKRQFDSALYQRLVLSSDKEKVKELALKGQILEKASDMLKDPYIIDFISMPQHASYTESDLEHQLIDKLPEENKTIGIILCQDKSDALVEITLPENNDQIFASQYEMVMPSKKVLKKLIEKQ